MKPWELREAELLKRENAYLEQYNWFEKLIDNHWTYLIVLFLVSLLSWNFGLLIGFLL